jgi:purine-cytosine permease-like protein
MSRLFPDDPQPKPETQFELELLKQEYFFLQTTIEDYNKQIWVIKALGITGTGAVIGLAFQQKQEVRSLVFLIGSVIPLFFWILESQWKHFQRGFYPRVAEIERILTLEHTLRSPAIFGEWRRAFRRGSTPHYQGYFWDGLFNRSVYVSYVLEIGFLLVLSLVLY